MRTDNPWENRAGGYIQTTLPAGYDILVNGSNHYLNFNTLVGSTGYGIRDNSGSMEFKDSGGTWHTFTSTINVPGGLDTYVQFNDASSFGGDSRFTFNKATGVLTFPTPFTLGAVSVTATGTQLNYLASATGTTGTTTGNLVFSISPTFTGSPVTPSIQESTAYNIINLASTSGTNYASHYPPAQSNTYVKATTTLSGYYACNSTDPTKSLTGSYDLANQWFSNWVTTNQRFHIDLGSAIAITRVYYENGHNYGGITNLGVKDFTLWGSNNAAAFADLTYADDTNWTQLTTSQSTFDQHVALDQADPKYILVTNTISYRYYAFKFANNWLGGGNYMFLRRIELQTYVGTNDISITAGGLERMRIYDYGNVYFSTGILLGDGSQSVPTLAFANCTATGFYHTGTTTTSTLLTSVNGANRMWISATETYIAGTLAIINSASAGVAPVATMVVGTPVTGGTFFMNTPGHSSGYSNGFGVSGTFTDASQLSLIQLCAYGLNASTYKGELAFCTTLSSGTPVEKARVTATGNLLLGTTTDLAASTLNVVSTKTIVSATSAVWNGILFAASTATLSGTTAITTSTGFNYATFNAPTITGGAVTVSDAATLYVSGAPTAAGSVTITRPWSFWVGGGKMLLGATTAEDFGAYTIPLTVNGTYTFVHLKGTGNCGVIYDYNGATGYLTSLNNTQDFRFTPLNGMNQSAVSNAKDGSMGLTIFYSGGGVAINTITNVASTSLRVLASKTIIASSSAIWDGIAFDADTVSLGNATPVTIATGFNKMSILAPTITSGTAHSLASAATVYISGAPILAGSIVSIIGQALKIGSGSIVCQGVALSTSATDGFLYIPTSAGTPTGVPTTQTGTCALEYDTSNNKLKVYNGSWKDVGGSGGTTATTLVNSATYNLLSGDYILHVTYTATGPVTNLRLMTAGMVDGRVIIIKDAGGNAGVNNITITTEGAETIDGADTYLMDSNYEEVCFYSNGSNWFAF